VKVHIIVFEVQNRSILLENLCGTTFFVVVSSMTRSMLLQGEVVA
jgi:hypothetical protein